MKPSEAVAICKMHRNNNSGQHVPEVDPDKEIICEKDCLDHKTCPILGKLLTAKSNINKFKFWDQVIWRGDVYRFRGEGVPTKSYICEEPAYGVPDGFEVNTSELEHIIPITTTTGKGG